MREFNALDGYPQPKERIVGKDIRTIKNRIIASYRDKNYYDGDRENGYGGYKYDGRWEQFIDVLEKEYGLNGKSSYLQLGCEKGFLMHDIKGKYPDVKVKGLEISQYPIDHAMPKIKNEIILGKFEKLPFGDNEFDIVIAIGVVYTMTLRDCIACLKEIQRVGNGKSFITIGAYYDEKSKRLFKDYWSLLGSTILHIDEWVYVLEEAGYTGDYTFVTSDTLNLKECD